MNLIKDIKKARLLDGELFINELFEKLKIKTTDDCTEFYIVDDKIIIQYLKNEELKISYIFYNFIMYVSNINDDNDFKSLMKKYIKYHIDISDDIEINISYIEKYIHIEQRYFDVDELVDDFDELVDDDFEKYFS